MLLAAAVILTIWSGLDYFKGAWAYLADEEPADEKPTVEETAGECESSVGVSWESATDLAAEVLEVARAKGVKLGTAESCTGGLVEASLTAVPGSSDVVMGAVGSYACSVKSAILGVSEQTLASVGAVSSECATEMAEGARKALGADVAVSVTGIAGPGGAVPGKPVGLVWFGLATPSGTTTVSETFSGNRSEVRLQSVMRALELLKGACE